MSYFTSQEIHPGIVHIGEPAGVHCTLIVGKEKALLFDTGYGICSIADYVRSITDLPLYIVNSHCHLDHAGGNHLFSRVWAYPGEEQIYADYQQEKVSILNQMEKLWRSGKTPRPWPSDFDRDAYLTFKPCRFLSLADHQIFSLGGRICEIISLPGHTRSSVILYDHLTGTVLSGDNIARSVWIMFAQSASLAEYRCGLKKLKKEYAVTGILSSHDSRLLPPSLIDQLIRCIDTRQENSTVFIHPRKGYKALKRKMYADGLGDIYLVYPLEDKG